ncbi:hypothetical protein LSAT2_018394 [Lamellibrachia satsuma]|nr:hypothetical protein LSAT2_018394 [Lamellibrachia satsuma]
MPYIHSENQYAHINAVEVVRLVGDPLQCDERSYPAVQPPVIRIRGPATEDFTPPPRLTTGDPTSLRRAALECRGTEEPSGSRSRKWGHRGYALNSRDTEEPLSTAQSPVSCYRR